MIELSDRDTLVFQCNFQINIQNANISIKFPCHYFIQWKSINGKVLASSNKYSSVNNSLVQFNQSLSMGTQMIFDNSKQQFYKKQTVLMVNLVSKSRPDQVKLVGRVNIDLAEIANSKTSIYSQYGTYKLTYCSVNADLTFSAQLTNKQLTSKQPNNLDRSSFNDYFAFNTTPVTGTQLQNVKSYEKQKLTSNIQNTTFPILKSKQQKLTQIYKRQNPSQKRINEDTQTVNNFPINNKNQDNSFRTLPPKKQLTFKSTTNDSYLHNNLYNFKQDKFCQQIDVNKRKISDLQKKIAQLCRSLQQSKNQMERKDNQNKEKQEIIMKLQQNENRIRQEYQTIKKMKSSDSFDLKIEQQEIKQFFQSQKNINKNHSPHNLYNNHNIYSPSSNLLNQKISQTLQTQRLLQQNQYIIRQLQSSKNDLQKKLLNQKLQSQHIQSIWRQKRQHYEQRIKSLQRQKKDLNSQIQGLVKFKYKSEQLNEQKNRIRQQYKQLQHQLMKARFELNDKIQKNAEIIEKYQLKQSQIEKYKLQNKEIAYEKNHFQRQLTQIVIQNQKLKDTVTRRDEQSQALHLRIRQLQSKLSNVTSELNQNKKIEQENKKMEQKLLMYNNYMQTLKNTIQNLQKQIQACQYISRINQNLKIQIARLQFTIKQKQNVLIQKDQTIKRKDDEIKNVVNNLQTAKQEKKYLLEKNQSFQNQIEKIQQILQESFHKKDNQSQQIITKLKEQIRVGNEEYQNILKQKQQLQDQIEHLIQAKQQEMGQVQKQLKNSQYRVQDLQYRVQDLLKTISDKLNIITMKQIELQNSRLISQQLTRKLQKMQQKQNQMQQTIMILQQQSRKIFAIIQQKQFIDQQLQILRKNTQQNCSLIQQLEDNIIQLKLQKQQISRKYLQQIQTNQEMKQGLNEKSNIMQRYLEEISQQRNKIQELEMMIQEWEQKEEHFMQQIKAKNIIISQLQQKHQTLVKSHTKLQNFIKIKSLNQQKQGKSIPQNYNPNLQYILHQKQIQLQQKIDLNHKNQQKFNTQIAELTNQNKTLTAKVIQLQSLLTNRDEANQQRRQKNNLNEMMSQKSHQLTPIKNCLNDQLLNKFTQNQYILSQRKKPISNRSGQSASSLQFVQNNNLEKDKPQHLNQIIPQLKFRQALKFRQPQKRQLDFQKIGVKLTNQEKINPQLKIQKLFSMIHLKNIIINELQNKQVEFKHKLLQLQQKAGRASINEKSSVNHKNQPINRNQQNFRGRIKPNTPKKSIQVIQNEQPQHGRSRTPSPSSKIVKNPSLKQSDPQLSKQNFIKKTQQIKRLKKNIRLMNLQLTTLRNLKKQRIIGGIQIKLNRSHRSHSQSNIQNHSQTNYFNLTNAVNPNQKSYIIRRIMNEEESIYDKKTSSPKKLSKYDQILKNRQCLQKRFNINSRISLPPHVLFKQNNSINYFNTKNKHNNAQNKQNYVQQRILDKLQNTANFTVYNEEKNQFITTIQDLRTKISQLQHALSIIQEQKIFLQDQIQLFQQQKFGLNSDLNSRQIQIYELYKSIVSMRQEISMLKYQNQAYLKMIQQHQYNVNSIVRKAEENCSKIKPQYNQKMSNIELSNIQYRNDQFRSQVQSDIIMKQAGSNLLRQRQNGIELMKQTSPILMRQSSQVIKHSLQVGRQPSQVRNQQRLSIIEKIERYQKKIQQSLILQKQKQILEQQIQSKQQILIDQNQKLYDQQNEIRNLNDQIKYLQQQLKKLTQIMKQKNQIEYCGDTSIIVHTNQTLLKQNQNLKQEILFLSNQIDRMNCQFTQLNNLLFRRQQQISIQKKQIQIINTKQIQAKQNYLNNIRSLECKIVEMEHIMIDVQNNKENQEHKILHYINQKIHDLHAQFQNLNTNIKNIILDRFFVQSEIENSQNAQNQYINSLLQSMQGNMNELVQGLTQILRPKIKNQSQQIYHQQYTQY